MYTYIVKKHKLRKPTEPLAWARTICKTQKKVMQAGDEDRERGGKSEHSGLDTEDWSLVILKGLWKTKLQGDYC